MVVEAQEAADNVEDNLNQVDRLSAFLRRLYDDLHPTSLDQPVGPALGAQAGFKRLAIVIGEGGFSRVRKSAETRFNMVIVARP